MRGRLGVDVVGMEGKDLGLCQRSRGDELSPDDSNERRRDGCLAVSPSPKSRQWI